MIREVESREDPLQKLARAAGDRPVPEMPESDLVAAAVLAARSRSRRRRERWGFAMAAVVLLAAGGVSWAVLRGADGSDPAVARAPMQPEERATPPEPPGGPRAPSTLDLPTGDRLVQLGETDLELVTTGLQRELVLGRGEMLFDVAPLAEGEAFVVRTPHLSARVVGTVFAVRVGEQSAVQVFEGEVQVDRVGHESMRLIAGESWSAAGSWASSLEDRAREAVRRRAQLAAQLAAQRAVEGPAPQPLVVPVTPSRLPGRRAGEPSLETVRGWLTEGEVTAALEAARASVGRRPGDGAWRMLLGDAQRVSGDRAAAAETYDVAATQVSESQATQAGFLAAELRLERGDPAGALRSLERARATERGSPIAERASALALRARARLDDREAFVRAARAYRLRFPTGSAGPWVERELQRLAQGTATPE